MFVLLLLVYASSFSLSAYNGPLTPYQEMILDCTDTAHNHCTPELKKWKGTKMYEKLFGECKLKKFRECMEKNGHTPVQNNSQ
ncbi:hypothetical protein PanWU01x14_046430, partial [Parasponia andersonii]